MGGGDRTYQGVRTWWGGDTGRKGRAPGVEWERTKEEVEVALASSSNDSLFLSVVAPALCELAQ